jgi:hypothetical protein
LTNTDIILVTRKALASPNWLAMPAKAVIQGGRRWADEKEKMGIACSDHTTLMSAITSSRQVNSWLSFKRWFQAVAGRAGGAAVKTTVDHPLMRGSEPHDR